MRVLIVADLNGQTRAAARMAADRGASVDHVETIEQATSHLRAGRGADLLMVDVGQDIAALIAANASERIAVPVVACGVATAAKQAADAIRAGAREFIPLPPEAEMIAAVFAAIADETPDAARLSMVGKTVAEVEQDLILETLDHCLGNRTHAANILGISIRTLRNKLKLYAERGAAVTAPGGRTTAGAA